MTAVDASATPPQRRAGRTHRVRLEQNPGDAVTGAIVTTGAIAASSLHDSPAWECLVEAATTLGVFFIPHAHAGFVAARFIDHTVPLLKAIGRAIVHQLPMLEVAVLPLAVLGLGALGLLKDGLAIAIALGIGVAELFLVGLWLGERRRVPLWRAALTALGYAAIGALLVVMKAALH
jgi:hypothetical protein